MTPTFRRQFDQTWPAATLIAASMLMLFAMAHHPAAHGDDFAAVVADMARQAPMDRLVHGALIALILAVLLAFVEISVRLGLDKPLVRCALVTYAIGACALCGAGLIDGFVVSWLSERYTDATAADLAGFRHLLRLAETGGVQGLASFGSLGLSFGVMFWSLALLGMPKPLRWLAATGLMLGLSPAIALLGGRLTLQAHGMMLVLACQVVWNVAVGVCALRHRLAGADEPLAPVRH